MIISCCWWWSWWWWKPVWASQLLFRSTLSPGWVACWLGWQTWEYYPSLIIRIIWKTNNITALHLSIVCHKLMVKELDVFIFSHLQSNINHKWKTWNVMFGFDVFLLLFFVVKVPLSHWSIVVMAWSLTKVTMLLSPASSSSFLTLIVYRITSPSCKCRFFVIRTIISDDHLHVMAKFIHCHPNHHPVAKPLRRYLWSWWNISELGGRSLPKGALLGEGRRMETTPENRVLIIIVLILSLMIVMRMATMINTGLDNIIMTRSPWILNSAHEAMKEFQNLVWLYQKVSE